MNRNFLLSSTALSAPADEGGSGGAAPSLSIETQVGNKPSTSVSLGEDNKMRAQRPAQEGIEANFSNGEVTTRQTTTDEADAEDNPDDETDEGAEPEGEKPEAEGEDKEGEDDAAPEDLPEFNADDEAVIEKYDERFYSEVDGKPVLNMETLGDEVYRNSQKKGPNGEDGTPALNEGTYAYLEARLGITKEVADDYIAGQIAKKAVAEDNFYKSAGGKEQWESQVAWGKANYTDAQKKRFNEVMTAKNPDPEAVQEQIDLLNARAVKGGWKPGKAKSDDPAPETKKGLLGAPRAKRMASPEKSAAGSEVRAAGSAKGYANNEEYVAALKAAGSDPAKQATVRANLKASAFWKPNRKG